ncbi:hypothetical protein PGT21_007877 [Puccinia graminis f. sp. tritici]|uniref:Uncharacterized protein n=2 Tax=Puccinia graminis f. sp. tritici TaxID=56615 RepID=E3JWS3_PUCGT|nr:uncharacterized protein PGTG_02939 [Puccinia graminis f. sp. tritici CRL 75-36-700-3]EFP76498.2 hypothetical protein PGTG_02939 [Puccinia graminis f. sp. tritici CRL 75-36-700-3]KAA1079321.1 hypothetical protein PGT21_007877 [Puccinia graminis f. sp. tritici]
MGFSCLTAFFISFFLAGLVSANWDPSTGYLHNYRPSPAWLNKFKPSESSPHVQVSECSINTRLHYPKVQVFAWFEVNHVWDGNHGCPYGTCHAYVVHPAAADMVPSFTEGHSFFWHKTGGLPGNGVKPISNPRHGGFGYEVSLTGKFIDGPANTQSQQLDHDGKYPGFNKKKLQLWSQAEMNAFKGTDQSQKHPKCGTPCGPNKDPGSAPGAYGGYKPASASTYKPPKGWKPNKGDTCFKNGPDLLPKPDPSKPGKGSGNLNKPKDEDSTTDPKHKNADNSTTKPKNQQQDSSTTDPSNKKDGSSTKTTKSSSNPTHRKKSLRKKCT